MDNSAEIEALSMKITALAREQAELVKKRAALGYRTSKQWQREHYYKVREAAAQRKAEARQEWLRSLSFDDRPLDEEPTSCRLANVMMHMGLKTVGDVLRTSPDFLAKHPNCGAKTLKEFAAFQAELVQRRPI